MIGPGRVGKETGIMKGYWEILGDHHFGLVVSCVCVGIGIYISKSIELYTLNMCTCMSIIP